MQVCSKLLVIVLSLSLSGLILVCQCLSLALGRPKPDTGIEIMFHKIQIEGQNHFTGPTSYILSNAAQCAVSLFDCRNT